MRLKEMRERVKSLTSYQAESATFHADVDADLNEALEEVWTHKHWTFRDRVVAIDIMPDIEGNVEVTAFNDVRYIEGFTVPILWPDRNLQVRPERNWIGQVLHIADRDYTIQEIQGEGSDDAIITTEPVRLESGGSLATSDWSLRQVHLRLPADCAEILGMVDADTPFPAASASGRIPGLPARRAEELDLSSDVTGTPECYVVEPPLIVPAAGKTTATWVAGGAPAASNTFGFTAVRYYEITWAYSIAGRIGPLAEPATVQVFPAGSVNAGNILVSLFHEDGTTPALCENPSSFSQQPWPMPGEGLRKQLYLNTNIDPTTGERLGLPCWVEVNRHSAIAAQEHDTYPLTILDLASTATINQPAQMNPKNPRLTHDPDGVHLQVRLYPRPNTADAEYDQETIFSGRTAPKLQMKKFLLRYLARPAKLAEAADSPAMPTEFHQIIIWKAVATLLRRCGDGRMASDYEKRAEAKMNSLVNAHTHRQDLGTVRGGWNYGTNGPALSRNVVFTES